MSNIRKLLDTINEMATVSGSVATVATPMSSTQRRDSSVYSEEKSIECSVCDSDPCKCNDNEIKTKSTPKVKDFGLWANSALIGSEQKKKKAKKSVKEDNQLVKSKPNRSKKEITATDRNGYTEFSGIDDYILKNQKPNTRKHPTQEKDVEEGLVKDIKRWTNAKDVNSRAAQEITKSQQASMTGDHKTAHKHFNRYDKLDKLANKKTSVSEGRYSSPVSQAITRRIIDQRSDLTTKFGPQAVMAAIDEVADWVGDVEEIGTSDVSGWVSQVDRMLRTQAGEGLREDNKQYNKFKVGQKVIYKTSTGLEFPAIVTAVDFDDEAVKIRSTNGQAFPNTGGDIEIVVDPGWTFLTPVSRVDPNSLVPASSYAESKENQLDRPEVQDAIKNMSKRHKDDEWSLEKSKELGKKLAARGQKTKQQSNLAEEERLEEQDIIINPKSIKRISRDVLPKINPRKDHEVDMARSDLYQSVKNAKQIFDMIDSIDESQGLEGWVQEKIIKAADYLNTVREYLEGEHVQHLRSLDEKKTK